MFFSIAVFTRSVQMKPDETDTETLITPSVLKISPDIYPILER